MVREYSKAKDGETKLQPNFKVKEFACKDGSDLIMISDETVAILQTVRNLIGSAITITSAYRTPAYNAKIGGAKKSQHMYGKACDTKSKYGARILARAYQFLGANGIGLYPYSPFCHVDTRDSKSYWKQDTKNGSAYSVSTFITKSDICQVQMLLNQSGFHCGLADGIIGPKTRNAFKDFCNNADTKQKARMIQLLQ